MLDRSDLNIILASNNAVIIGASVGAVVGLILIVFSILLVYCLKKQRDRNKRTESELNKLTETINSVTRRDLTPLPSLPSRILPSGFDESLISVSLILLPSWRVVSLMTIGFKIDFLGKFIAESTDYFFVIVKFIFTDFIENKIFENQFHAFKKFSSRWSIPNFSHIVSWIFTRF